jgi:hypothetical protein
MENDMRQLLLRDNESTRRTLFVFLALALALLVVPQDARAGKPRNVCPPGFDLGGLTFEEALQLPNTQAGLAAGIYDEATLAQAFDSIDANGDDVICFQSIPASGTTPNPASGWQFFNNTVDNNASVPGG